MQDEGTDDCVYLQTYGRRNGMRQLKAIDQ